MASGDTPLQRLKPFPALVAYTLIFFLTAFSSMKAFYFIGAFSLFYSLLDFQVLLLWIRFVARISVFFIVYILSGFFFYIPFPEQLHFILRIVLFLLISTMIVRSVTLDGLYRSVSFIQSRKLRDFSFYLFCTLMFIPVLFQEYDALRKEPGKRSLKLYVERLEKTFHGAMDHGERIASEATRALDGGEGKSASLIAMLTLFFYTMSVIVIFFLA